MWFQFPEGSTSITVERQEFKVEVVGENGVGYFRAPSHFAPIILSLKGFGLAVDLPTDAPADHTAGNTSHDSAIQSLGASLDAKNTEVQGLQEDLNAAKAQIAALTAENAQLTTELENIRNKVAELEEQIEDGSVAQPLLKGKPALKATA